MSFNDPNGKTTSGTSRCRVVLFLPSDGYLQTSSWVYAVGCHQGRPCWVTVAPLLSRQEVKGGVLETLPAALPGA